MISLYYGFIKLDSAGI